MPSAIKHDQELAAKGLVTILVESQGADQPNLEAFLWKRFPDNGCFTCTGTFVPLPESRGIPHAGVLGVDGTLLWAGNPLSAPQKIEELIAAELEKVKKGWGDTPEARRVRALLYGKGDFAGALATVAAMPAGQTRDALQGEIERRYASKKQAIETLKQRGRWLDAQAAAIALQKGVAQNALATEVATIVGAFETEAGKAELALDRKLERIEKQLRDKKAEPAHKALRSLVDARKGETSAVAARAAALLAVLELKI